jgi:hypothetical protein
VLAALPLTAGLAPGTYTVKVFGPNDITGVDLVEIYELP